MADDAAGAVRRTPRPAAPPDLWWSPSMARFLSRHEDQDDEHLVWVWHGHHESLRHFLGTGVDSNPPLPDDAVQLAPVPAVARGEHAGPIKGGSVIDWVKHMVAEYTDEVGSPPPPEIVAHITVAVLREMGWERRPVVLLRAEDYRDLDTTPEDARQHFRNVAAQRDVEHQAHLAAAAERDEAVALCANLQTTILSRLAELTEAAGKQRSTEWLRTCATLPMEKWPPAPAYKGPMVPAAELAAERDESNRWRDANGRANTRVDEVVRERDALQARTAELEASIGYWKTRLGEAVAERQARIDAANLIVSRAIDEGLPAEEALRMLDRVLAGKTDRALQGDQPTEPEPEVIKLGWKPNGLGGWDRTCTCEPDCCLGEGDPPNRCEHCATIDGELPCPIADAEPTATPPDPSGRIVNSGPVVPFADGEVDRG